MFSIQQLEMENNCVIFCKRCSPVLSRHSFTIMLSSHAQLSVVEIDGGEQRDWRRGVERDGGDDKEEESV